MAQPNSVDEATIRATLDAFEQTMANVNGAMQAVDSVSSAVPWSGVAATQYRNSLAAWIGGVTEVRNGLEQLRTAMMTHLHVSSKAEDEAASMSNWYTA